MTGTTSLDDLGDRVREEVGFRLFTVLGWVPRRRALRRLWTSDPAAYPTGGEKTLEVDPAWLTSRVEGRTPFLGADLSVVRSVFADAATIEALGCGAVLNTTVSHRGRTLAVLSALDAEGAYDLAHLDRLARLTPEFVPPVIAATAATADPEGDAT